MAGSPSVVIHVTQEDIDSAIKNSSHHCAVATAITRQIPDAGYVSVDIQTIRYSDMMERKRYIFLTPEKIMDYIVAFDAGDEVKPFDVRLYRPAWTGEMNPWAPRNPDGLGARDPDGPTYHAEIHIGKQASEANIVREKRQPLPRIRHRDREFGKKVLRQNQKGE